VIAPVAIWSIPSKANIAPNAHILLFLPLSRNVNKRKNRKYKLLGIKGID
jgi:hypothetical protein